MLALLWEGVFSSCVAEEICLSPPYYAVLENVFVCLVPVVFMCALSCGVFMQKSIVCLHLPHQSYKEICLPSSLCFIDVT